MSGNCIIKSEYFNSIRELKKGLDVTSFKRLPLHRGHILQFGVYKEASLMRLANHRDAFENNF